MQTDLELFSVLKFISEQVPHIFFRYQGAIKQKKNKLGQFFSVASACTGKLDQLAVQKFIWEIASGKDFRMDIYPQENKYKNQTIFI